MGGKAEGAPGGRGRAGGVNHAHQTHTARFTKHNTAAAAVYKQFRAVHGGSVIHGVRGVSVVVPYPDGAVALDMACLSLLFFSFRGTAAAKLRALSQKSPNPRAAATTKVARYAPRTTKAMDHPGTWG